MAKVNVEINKAVLYLEHYLYATAGSAAIASVIAWQAKVSYYYVFMAFVSGLVGPLLARANSKSVVNAIAKDTGLPTALVQNVANVAVQDATKLITPAPVADATPGTTPPTA